jgi:hypothetical protein
MPKKTTKKINSVNDFEKKYFPEAFKRKNEKELNADELGIQMAKESLSKVKENLQK